MTKYRNPPRWALWMVLGLSFASGARAQEEEAASEAREEHFHKHELALILASTYEAEEGNNLFTIGGEYERRFGPRFGLSAAFEHLSEVGSWVFVFPATFRVYRELKLLAGPGFEHESRRPQTEGQEQVEGESAANDLFLFRIGAQYAFKMGDRYAVVPGIELDWTDAEHGVATAVVYGVNSGIAF